jgi:outer membrane protein assembly factor BamB
VRAFRVVVALSALAAMTLLSAPSVGATTIVPPDVWSSESGGGGNAATNAGEHVITAATAVQLKQAWKLTTPSGAARAPAIVNGVIYHAYNSALGLPDRLVAASAKTGATLWSTTLPGDTQFTGRDYTYGLTVVGNLALMPYSGWWQAAGIVAVNITTHKVAWSASEPNAPSNGQPSHPMVVDSGRAYVYNYEGNLLYAFRVSDGKLLWHVKSPVVYIAGTAAVGGVLYVSDEKYGGTVALNGATGTKLWSTPIGSNLPVVAGGRLIAASGQYVAAANTSGCGQSTCPWQWRDRVPGAEWISVGGADANTVFVTATIGTSPRVGVIERLSAVTGKVQWSAALPPFPGSPVRIGNTVWLISYADTLIGFSTTATKATPLRSIKIADNNMQQIAGANGTLVVFTWTAGLTGYRIPGT